MLVPLIVLYRRGRGQLERMATPGPAMLTSPPFGLMPPFENGATRKFASSAATAMMDGLLAGRPTGAGGSMRVPSGLLLSLPAAAIIKVPAFKARCAAVS